MNDMFFMGVIFALIIAGLYLLGYAHGHRHGASMQVDWRRRFFALKLHTDEIIAAWKNMRVQLKEAGIIREDEPEDEIMAKLNRIRMP